METTTTVATLVLCLSLLAFGWFLLGKADETKKQYLAFLFGVSGILTVLPSFIIAFFAVFRLIMDFIKNIQGVLL